MNDKEKIRKDRREYLLSHDDGIENGNQNRQSRGECEPLPSKSGERQTLLRKGKGNLVAKVGDLISVSPGIFDEDDGAYSRGNPGLVFGQVNSNSREGIADISWVDENSQDKVKKKEETGFPKDFFEVLVKEDWRKWVEAVQ